MLHMNHHPRYQRIYEDLITVYACRGTNSAHYIAGSVMGMQIVYGLSEIERHNLNKLFDGARNAKR